MIGIYKIENKINSKKYIGQSWDIEKRWKSELCGKINSHLKSSFKKYGVENFTFEVVESLTETTQEELNALEEKYINQYSTTNDKLGYNKMSGGSKGKPNKETRDKLSIARSGIRNHFYGKKHTQASRDKISLSRQGRFFGESNPNYGKKASQETKDKMSLKLKGKKATNARKVLCIETGEIFNSIKLACEKIGVSSSSSLVEVLKNPHLTCKKFHWKYLT